MSRYPFLMKCLLNTTTLVQLCVICPTPEAMIKSIQLKSQEPIFQLLPPELHNHAKKLWDLTVRLRDLADDDYKHDCIEPSEEDKKTVQGEPTLASKMAKAIKLSVHQFLQDCMKYGCELPSVRESYLYNIKIGRMKLYHLTDDQHQVLQDLLILLGEINYITS